VRTKVANDPESGFDGIDPEDVPDLLEEEEAGLIPEGAGRGLQAELEQAEGKPQDGGEDGGIQNFDDGDAERKLRRDRLIEAGGDQGANLEEREGKPSGFDKGRRKRK